MTPLMICFIGFSIYAYFFPSFLAWLRGHRNAGAIFALNFFLGWTFIGWVASLVWSLTNQEHSNGS